MFNIASKISSGPMRKLWLSIAVFICMGMSTSLWADPNPDLVQAYQRAIRGEVFVVLVPDLAHAEALASVLKTNENITDIHLYSEGAGAEGVKLITDVLNGKENIKKLEFVNWKMGVLGAQYLADYLNSSRLEKLTLKNDDIGAEGTKLLANALAKNSFLNSLNLIDVEIGGTIGAGYLNNGIKENFSLYELVILKGERGFWAPEAKETFKIFWQEHPKNLEILLSLRTYPDLMGQMLAQFNLPDSDTLFSRLPKELIRKVLEELVKLKKQKIKEPT